MALRNMHAFATLGSIVAITTVAAAQDVIVTLPLDGPIDLSVPLGPGATLTVPQNPTPPSFTGQRQVNLTLSVTGLAGFVGFWGRSLDAPSGETITARLHHRIIIEPPPIASHDPRDIGLPPDPVLMFDLVSLSAPMLLNAGDEFPLSFPATSLTGSVTWVTYGVQEALNGTGEADLPISVASSITLLGDDGYSYASFYSATIEITGEIVFSYSEVPGPASAALLALGVAVASRRSRR